MCLVNLCRRTFLLTLSVEHGFEFVNGWHAEGLNYVHCVACSSLLLIVFFRTSKLRTRISKHHLRGRPNRSMSIVP